MSNQTNDTADRGAIEISQAKQRAREFLVESDAEPTDVEGVWAVIPRHLFEFAEQESWADRDELDDLKVTFDLQWEAGRRATKRWQDAHPEKPNTWPDRVDLVLWLDQELSEQSATIAQLVEAAEAVVVLINAADEDADCAGCCGNAAEILEAAIQAAKEKHDDNETVKD